MSVLIMSVYCVFLFEATWAKVPLKHNIPDGLYLIAAIDSTAAQRANPAAGVGIWYSQLFEEFKKQALTRIVVDTNEFVPLDLSTSPKAVPQAAIKKKLLLTLTPAASEKLRSFSKKYLTRKVALVVDGEAISVENINEAISNGQLQIMKCTDKACERLYFKLEDNVKK